jgi:hypothetical protein
MSEAQRLRDLFFEDNLRDLNRLVFAAEALEAPEPFERPGKLAWDKCPSKDDPDTLEGALALLEEWRNFASALDDSLADAETSDEDHGNAVAGLREKAKAARAALVRLDIYHPPVVGSP